MGKRMTEDVIERSGVQPGDLFFSFGKIQLSIEHTLSLPTTVPPLPWLTFVIYYLHVTPFPKTKCGPGPSITWPASVTCCATDCLPCLHFPLTFFHSPAHRLETIHVLSSRKDFLGLMA